MPKQLTNVEPVNDYATIHPALDFWDGIAIVSVGCKWQENWTLTDKYGNPNGSEIHFTNNPYCVLSTGDKFRFSKEELAKRQLFYSGKIELPEQSRWSYEDIHKFDEDGKSLSFPKLFKLIRDEFEYYLDYIDDRYFDLMACFVIYTYFYPMFFNAPVLQLWGEMRSGKTKNLSLLEAMVFNPINSANISSSSVFRLVESRRSTILFDESEDLMSSERSREIRNMLLAGTGKSGETFRQEKGDNDTYATRSFRVFSPKVIANIAGIDLPALLSRTIRISTVATKNKTKDNRCVEIEDDKWQAIRNELYRICLDKHRYVESMRFSMNGGELSGRTYYIWQGILTIARMVDNEELLKNLMEFAKENREEMEADIEEFSDDQQKIVRKLLELPLEEKQFYTNEELMQHLTYDIGLHSSRDLGRKLSKLGFKSRVLREKEDCRRYYYLTKDKLERLKKW